jgi:ribokinase
VTGVGLEDDPGAREAVVARVGVIGSSNLDLTFRVPRLPGPGETLPGSGLLVGFGGKGANQAVTAARLGAEVVFVSCVGDDDFGERMLRHYAQEGIATSFIRRIPKVSTGSAAILVDDAARNSIVVVAGANAHLETGDVAGAAEALRSVRVLLAQRETPLEATLEAFRIARAVGATTILNPAPALPLPDEALRWADLCVPNETEAAVLTGCPVGTAEEAETTARVLLDRGCGAVILTRGDQGALLADRNGCRHVPAVPVRAVDTTGAGDAFLGALAVALAEGQDLDRAVGWARLAAALSVTRPGAQSSFPTRTEVEKFATESGVIT